MEVIGQQPGDVFLVKVSEETCSVVDLKVGKIQSPQNCQVIIKWGYWESPSITPEKEDLIRGLFSQIKQEKQ